MKHYITIIELLWGMCLQHSPVKVTTPTPATRVDLYEENERKPVRDKYVGDHRGTLKPKWPPL